MIIDFEHHYTPYEIWKRRGGKPGQTVRVFSPDGRAVRSIYDTSYNIETHLKHMDIAGIDMAVLTGSADSMEEAKLFNESCAKVVEQYPKKFLGFAATLPLKGKEALNRFRDISPLICEHE
jgi:predicted TIM-barrel fold metal-dependent hydrolase